MPEPQGAPVQQAGCINYMFLAAVAGTAALGWQWAGWVGAAAAVGGMAALLLIWYWLAK